VQAQTGQLPSFATGTLKADRNKGAGSGLPFGAVNDRRQKTTTLGPNSPFPGLIKSPWPHSVTLGSPNSQKVRVPHRKFIAKQFSL
jgi:hypothetical protein